MIPFTFPTYVQGDGTIACRAKVITDTTGLVRWIDYTPIKFVASMTNMGTTNNDGSQAIELITQTTGLVKGIDYIVVYVDSSATVPWSTNANGYIPCYSAPYSLFASSETGVWYDPSDFTTLFQDSAGTTPVTAVEQPVGLMLDKSKGLVLGSELVTNGGFDSDTAWTKHANTTIVGGVASTSGIASFGTMISQNVAVVAGKTYSFGITSSKVSGSSVSLSIGATVIYNIGPSGTYRGYFVAPATGAIAFYVWENSGGTWVGSIDNISVKELPGNHATQATAASRPILKQDANGKYYLLFDGVDDSMATGSIDFTATDKMTVFAGVRKLSDAAVGMIYEIGSDYTLSSGVATYNDAAGRFHMASAGTAFAEIQSAIYAAPTTKLITLVGNISAPLVSMRVNATFETSLATTQGTGNYGNKVLTIGARTGTVIPFNGNLYSLIVRGAQSSAAQIASAETYVNGKTGAY